MSALESKLVWNGTAKKNEMDTAVFKALIRCTDILQDDAKLRVRKKDGYLNDSIVKSVDKNSQIGTVSTDMDYALAQEFGLRSKGKPNYSFTPYMLPALNNNAKTYKKIFIEEGEKVTK